MKSLLPPELQAKWDVRDTVPRRDRLRELAFAGYRIPRCGLFADMVRLGVPLVVYTDELAHCGEGKVLYKPCGFVPDFPADEFCSEYVPDSMAESGVALSRRYLVVGEYEFVLVYRSRSSWMSNVDGECELVKTGSTTVRRHDDLMPYPMYSIDRTIGYSGDYVSFDLNTCPGVPLEVVNMVGREVLTASVADFCRERGLL